MKLICNHCHDILSDDCINEDTDLALCKKCGTSFFYHDLIDHKLSVPPILKEIETGEDGSRTFSIRKNKTGFYVLLLFGLLFVYASIVAFSKYGFIWKSGPVLAGILMLFPGILFIFLAVYNLQKETILFIFAKKRKAAVFHKIFWYSKLKTIPLDEHLTIKLTTQILFGKPMTKITIRNGRDSLSFGPPFTEDTVEFLIDLLNKASIPPQSDNDASDLVVESITCPTCSTPAHVHDIHVKNDIVGCRNCQSHFVLSDVVYQAEIPKDLPEGIKIMPSPEGKEQYEIKSGNIQYRTIIINLMWCIFTGFVLFSKKPHTKAVDLSAIAGLATGIIVLVIHIYTIFKKDVFSFGHGMLKHFRGIGVWGKTNEFSYTPKSIIKTQPHKSDHWDLLIIDPDGKPIKICTITQSEAVVFLLWRFKLACRGRKAASN